MKKKILIGLTILLTCLGLIVINSNRAKAQLSLAGDLFTVNRLSAVNGIVAQAPFRVVSPQPGSGAYTTINTNGTTLANTILYCSEVFLPTNKTLTGIAILNGTTVGTDAMYVALYSSSGGTALANSALAGVTAANASTYQERSFTSTYAAVGPATYFACFQTAGTTATVRMATTGQGDIILTKGQTGATFGTLPSLIVPTTFTTAVGPYVYLF